MVKIGLVIVPQNDDSAFPKARIVASIPGSNNSGTCVYLMRLEGDPCAPFCVKEGEINAAIDGGDIKLEHWVPRICKKDASQIKERAKQSADRNWERIAPIIVDTSLFLAMITGDGRGDVLNKLAASKSEKVAVYRAFYRYLRNGMSREAMRPTNGQGLIGHTQRDGTKKRGRKSTIGAAEGIPITGALLLRVERSIRRECIPGRSRETVYTNVLLQLFSTKSLDETGRDIATLNSREEQPTSGQLRRIYDRLNIDHSLDRKRIGSRIHDTKYPTGIHSSHAGILGPGELCELDDTGSQIEIVSETSFQPVGTAFVYLAIDVWSKLITGFYANVSGSTGESVRLTVFNTVSPKAEFCARYEVYITDEEWPAQGFSLEYLSDNGSSLVSKEIESMALTTPSDLANARAYTAVDKANVERRVKKLKDELLRHLEGWRPKNGQQRATGNPKKRACLTLFELRREIIRWILQYNKRPLPLDAIPSTAREAQIEPTPISLWNWGMANCTGRLIQYSQEELYVRLLPQDQATVTDRGLRFKRFFYSSREIENRRWFSAVRRSGHYTVPIRVNPARPDQIYLQDKSSNAFITCDRVDDDGYLRQFDYVDADTEHKLHNHRVLKIKHDLVPENVQSACDIESVNTRAKSRAKSIAKGSGSKMTVTDRRLMESSRQFQADRTSATHGQQRARVSPEEPVHQPTQSDPYGIASYVEDAVQHALKGSSDEN